MAEEITKTPSLQESGLTEEIVAASFGAKKGEDGSFQLEGFEVNDDAESARFGIKDEHEGEEVKFEEKPAKETKEIKADFSKEIATEKTNEEVASKSFDELLAEKFEGKYKNFDELTEALTPKKVFANELMEKLNEFSATHSDPLQAIELFAKYQALDVEKMDKMEAVKTQMRMANPDMTEREIELELKDKYKLDEDRYDEDTVEASQLKLDRESRKAKAELTEMKQKLFSQGDKAEVEAKNREQYEKSKSAWDKDISQKVSSLKDLTFKISEKENFEFKIDNDTKKEVAKTLNAMHDDALAFFKSYKTEKGGYDMQRIAEDTVKIKHFDAIMAAALNRANTTGKMDIVKDLKNSSLGTPSNPKTATQGMSVNDQVFAQVSKYL